jgi:hypothetical protein
LHELNYRKSNTGQLELNPATMHFICTLSDTINNFDGQEHITQGVTEHGNIT